MSHPACCKDPDNCTLAYRDHIAGFGVSAMATPNRLVNRSPGVPDEPLVNTLIREQRWDRDMGAFERLHKEGLTPPRVDGSALRERQGESAYDVLERPVKIDYKDPR